MKDTRFEADSDIAPRLAGVCNTHYGFDPRKDVAGVLMTQTLPFVEPPFMRLYGDFERAVYRAWDK